MDSTNPCTEVEVTSQRPSDQRNMIGRAVFVSERVLGVSDYHNAPRFFTGAIPPTLREDDFVWVFFTLIPETGQTVLERIRRSTTGEVGSWSEAL